MPDEIRSVPGLADVVTALVSQASIEVTPREVRKHPGLLAEILPPKTRVYATFLPNTPFEDTVSAVASVVEQGLVPVPHLAARNIADIAELDRIIGRLAQVGVTELLVIAGSLSEPKGGIADSLQVLRSGVLERHGISRVGVAGHPEGNKDIGEMGLEKALREKNEFAAQSGVETYLLTQFCFDAEPIVQWEQRIRSVGNRLPVFVGLPGLSSPVNLLKFGLACGVGASLKVLRKQSGGVLKLATTPVYYPDQTLVGLARAVAAEPESLLTGAHFFPFGALRATAGWCEQVRSGRFTIDSSGRRIHLLEQAR